MKKKIKFKLKIILILIVVIILIILLHFIRNTIIISSLINKSSKYKNVDNYHIIWSTYSNEQTTIFDVYYKDKIYKQTLTNYDYNRFINDNEAPSKVVIYRDGNGKEMTYFYSEKVLYSTNSNENANSISPKNMTHIEMAKESALNFILTCFNSVITSSECNNIKSYKSSFIIGYPNTTYFSKETGLTLRSVSGYSYINDNSRKYTDTFSDIIYEFNTVTDEDISIPNTEGFTIQEKQ